MIEFNIPLPAGVSIAAALVIGVGYLCWQGRGIVERLKRVEENTENHEEFCNERYAKVDKRLENIETTQAEMREDISWIKAKLNGDKP